MIYSTIHYTEMAIKKGEVKMIEMNDDNGK